jgi:hypothetical protein
METFHRQRVAAATGADSLLSSQDGGVLVLHLIPRSCALGRTGLDGAKLKEHGRNIPALRGQGYSYSRFNVDGLLNYEGRESIHSYTQIFRDGRLEAAKPDVAFEMDYRGQSGPRCLRDAVCERAVINTVAGYLRFCIAAGLEAPIWMFSAIIGCKGVRICTDPRFRDASEHGIDRSTVFFPGLEIVSLVGEPLKLLRSWCDVLWQTCGMERSFNFNDQGEWRERR